MTPPVQIGHGVERGKWMPGVWLAIAFAYGLAAQRIALPPLVGYLAAGFTLGGLGQRVGPGLAEIAHVGVLLMLFGIGLKVRLRNVVQREVWGTALLHLLLISTTFGALFMAWHGVSPWVAVLLAAALGFSSTVLAGKALEEARELRSFHGRVAIGVLVVQDLAAVALLGFAGDGVPSVYALGVFALPLLRWPLHRLLDVCGRGELMLLFGVFLALAAGGAGFGAVGLSPELGALLLGTLIADHPRAAEFANALWSLREVFLVGFFLSIGMTTGLPGLHSLAIAAVLLALLPIKGVLFLLILLRFGLRARTGLLAALALSNYSEFGLIAAAVAVKAGTLPAAWLATLAVAVAGSFALSARLNHAAHRIYARLGPWLVRLERPARHPDDEPIGLGAATVVVVGMGRVGTGAYLQMRDLGARVVGLDSDPGKVEKHRRDGLRVVYADAEDPGLWQRLELGHVEAVLVAIPDLQARLTAVTRLRANGFVRQIAVNAVYAEEEALLQAAGADLTFDHYALAGHNFAQMAWTRLTGAVPGQERIEVDEKPC